MLSGLNTEGLGWNFGTVKRALIATGRPLPGYSRIEAGGGVVDIPRAWDALRAFAEAGEGDLVTIYTVRTEAPAQPDGEAPAAYWRSGGWFPTAPEQQEFRVTPRFASTMNADAQNKFYRAFRLKSDVDWIRIDRKDTYINGPSERSIFLSYDADKLDLPGVHVGRVIAEAKDTGRNGDAAFEFELVVTIVVPHRFDTSGETVLKFDGQTLDPGAFQRSFFRVPAGAPSMTVSYEVPDGEQGDVRLVGHDPDGRRHLRAGYADHAEQPQRSYTISGDDLVPGVYTIQCWGSASGKMEVSVPAQGTVRFEATVYNAQKAHLKDVNGSFAKAGVRDGDLLIGIDGQEFTNERTMQAMMTLAAERKSVSMMILRGGRRLTIPVDFSQVWNGQVAGVTWERVGR